LVENPQLKLHVGVFAEFKTARKGLEDESRVLRD
jgi:hypothetical protein